jgi:hypothetical protein
LNKAHVILRNHSSKWRAIGTCLGFSGPELDEIQAKPLDLLHGDYLGVMLSAWHEWAPGDARGSTSYATLLSLKIAVDKAGLGVTAEELHK